MRPAAFIATAAVFAAFGAYSLYVMWELGYVGLWEACMANIGTWQLLLDFIILSGLALVWMVGDARRTGRTVWPYALITVSAGSFGPLLYLLLAPRTAATRQGREATA
ncbi:DUF2834 domain-containing protein [Roseateles sp. DC23W]|uniref:DUF2834 domain-containing protein n=1 Tax=Pelomonas dachongensis TaxID=3299029 RepID=A0ABW7EP59_9BURK